MRLRYIAALISLGVAWGLAARAAAPSNEAEAAFYRDKTMNLIVSGNAGGDYDAYARLLASRMDAYIPGNPKIIVQNMPGAGGFKATNYIYSVAPRDGTYFASVSAAIPIGPLMSPKSAEYDTKRLIWLGSIARETRVGYVWETSPVKTLDDAKRMVATMGGTALGAGTVDLVLVANDLFGFKFKLVSGYKGAPDVKLALERGEIDGIFGNAYDAIPPEWMKDRKVRILTQFGFAKHPDLPNVPLFIELAKTSEERQILDFLLARQEASTPYIAPPDVPAARVTILRRAFDSAIRDEKFLAAAKEAKLPVDGPMTGEALTDLTAKLADIPQPTIQRVNAIFEKFRGAK